MSGGNCQENILHSMCEIKGITCSLIANGDSSRNVVALEVVEMIYLPTLEHPHTLERLDDSN